MIQNYFSVKDTRESFTYVEDVVQVVDKIIELGPSVWNEAYNVAVDESVTLNSILSRMAKSMSLNLSESDFPTDGDFYLYPTVFAGPISIEVYNSS